MNVIEIRNKEEISEKLNNEILSDSFNIYVRVSTKDQIDNTSLDNQKDFGINYFKKNLKGNFKNVIVWREEGKSGDDIIREDSVGDIVSRELLSSIINYWEDGIVKNLWVYDLSRLSRNGDTSTIIKSKMYRYGIDFYENTQKYNFDKKTEKLMFQILSSFNEFENTLRFEKGLMGKRRILDDNKHWGGILPIGYKKDENGRLIEDEKTSKFVKMMFKYYSEGKSTVYLKNLLERIGVETMRGNTIWNLGSIRKILSNPLYLGELKYEVKGLKGKSKEYCREKGMVTNHIVKVPQLIDNKTFEKVQYKFNYNKKLKPTSKNEYFLRGLLHCGSCGSFMYGKINPKINLNVYSCHQNINKKHRNNTLKKCSNFKSINIDLVDELVWLKVVSVWENSEIIKEKFRNENLPSESDLRDNQRRIRNLNNKILRRTEKLNEVEVRKDEILELYLNLKLSKDRMDNLLIKVEENINKIKNEISELNTKISLLKSSNVWESWFEDFKNYSKKIRNYTDIIQKQNFLNQFVDKIDVYWDEITNTHKIKIHFSIKIVEDKGKEKGNFIFDIKKGKKSVLIKGINSPKLTKIKKKNPHSLTTFLNHSTVTELSKNIVNLSNVNIINDLSNVGNFNLRFTISFKTSKLTKIHHYNPYQNRLFRIVEKLRDDYGYGYKKISDFLISNNFKTVRSNKDILPNYVFSIYKKGKNRINRIEREFDTEVESVVVLKS